MAFVVVCPKCSEELEIPDELSGQSVRCAACSNVFAAARGAAPTVSRQPRLDTRDEDRNTSLDERPVRRPPAARARSGRVWLWVMLFGTFGTCCLGCGGVMVVAVVFDNPKMVPWTSPDGKFVVGFPGAANVSSAADDELARVTTTVEHTRTIMGQNFETYFVQHTDLPRRPKGDLERDQQLITAADAYVKLDPGDKETRRAKITFQGYPALEVEIEHPEDVTTIARVVLVEKRVYILGIRGRSLMPESRRLNIFWDKFQLTTPLKEGEKV